MVPTRPRKMHSLGARSSPTLSGAQEEAAAVEEHGGANARSNDGITRTLCGGIAGLGYAADASAAKCAGNALGCAYGCLVCTVGYVSVPSQDEIFRSGVSSAYRIGSYRNAP
jgi:hypothetical protein